MSKTLGLICEDRSDYEVFIEIVKKYLKPGHFKVKKFIGNGCGKISNKCEAWVRNLTESGCRFIFVIQDLDTKAEQELRMSLTEKVTRACPALPFVIVIPVREVESWLLTDPLALKATFGFDCLPKPPSNPESVSDPKREIGLIVKKYRKNMNLFYSNTLHNSQIAQLTSLQALKRCASYMILDEFFVSTFNLRRPRSRKSKKTP